MNPPSNRSVLGQSIRTILLCGALAGCGSAYIKDADVRLKSIESSARTLSVDRTVITVPEALRVAPSDHRYRVGPGDRMQINIFGEPGLESVQALIDADGFIQLPVVETLKVGGMTTREIQRELTVLFEQSFRDPWVVVSLTDYGSRPVYFLGELNRPGVAYMDRPTNLVQALSLADGLGPDAYLPGARLLRNNEIVPVDIDALLRDGRFDQNVWIEPGDTIYVPAQRDLKVYVLGAVKLPGAQAFDTSQTILEALSQAQGHWSKTARLANTRVIRTHSPTRGELLVVNVRDILTGRVPDMPLQAGDVVFVPTSAVGTWNEIIELVAPSVSMVSGAIEPFVQLEFLTQN